MRELVYVSRNKLSEFKNDAGLNRWTSRLRAFALKAPLGLGEIDLTIEDDPNRLPRLNRIVNSLNQSREVGWFEDPNVKAGDWVQFECQLVKDVVSVEPIGESPSIPMVLFWRPIEENKNGWTRLILHGSVANLVSLQGVTPRTVEVYGGSETSRIWVLVKQLANYAVALDGTDKRPSASARALVYHAMDHLRRRIPDFTASWMAGYARVSWTSQYELSQTIVASPLYVERVDAPTSTN